MPPPPLSPQRSSLSADKDEYRGSGIHSDILHAHIFTRLDGPALAAAGCASSELHALASDQALWRKICTSTWPSITDPRVDRVISTMPSGYRSFFSDSYPLVRHSKARRRREPADCPAPAASGLISAVDIHHRGAAILSKVVETETQTPWFQTSPFRVDLLECKEFAHAWAPHPGEGDTWLKELEENVTLSWIVMDPERRRSMNVSSQRPVSAQRHWLTGEVQLKFAVVMAGDDAGGSWWGTEKEYVECGVVVTCGGKEGGAVQVREVSLAMEDLEGRGLSGRDSLVILLGAMERGQRKRRGSSNNGGEEKELFEEFLARKREWKVIKQREEKVLDFICITIGVTIFIAFLSLFLFRRF